MIETPGEFIRRKESKHPTIKFKTVGCQFLPYLKQNPLPKVLSLSKFTKKSCENQWEQKSKFSKQIQILKVKQQEQHKYELQKVKLQLKNEANSLLLQRKYMQKRFQTNLLIRTAMKQLAINQQQLLATNNYFEG